MIRIDRITMAAAGLVVATASVPARAQDAGALALSQFETKVQQATAFLSQPRQVVVSGSWMTGPSRKFYRIAEIKLVRTSHDVRKTDSLVTPFVAQLDLIVENRHNGSCGDLKAIDGNIGWSELAPALAAAGRTECFGAPGRGGPYAIRLTYAYQAGAWILSTATIPDADNRRDGTIGPALGLGGGPTEPDAFTFNRPWLVLV